MKETTCRLNVGVDGEGERLDLFLSRRIEGVSRKKIKRALDRGQVRVDGDLVRTASRALNAGEEVVATVAIESRPVPDRLSVLFRDAHLLAVDKPSGMPPHRTSHPGPHALELATSLVGTGARPPILLHRLDIDTSGVLLFALSDHGNRELARQFAEREVQKTYLALVQGSPPPAFHIENHLKTKHRGRTVAMPGGTQWASTEFTTLQRGPGFALVEARPKTGRTHQIRAHLSEAGFPLLGDPLYGGSTFLEVSGRVLSVPRHLLHASQLAFLHPTTPIEVVIKAPLPKDFLRFLDTLEKFAARSR